MLEDREGPLTREIVVGSIRKRFESTPYMQKLAKGIKASSGDWALAINGQPSRPKGSRRKGKPRKSQGPGRGGYGDQDTSSHQSTPPPNSQSIGGYDDVALSHLSEDDNTSIERLSG